MIGKNLAGTRLTTIKLRSQRLDRVNSIKKCVLMRTGSDLHQMCYSLRYRELTTTQNNKNL